MLDALDSMEFVERPNELKKLLMDDMIFFLLLMLSVGAKEVVT